MVTRTVAICSARRISKRVGGGLVWAFESLGSVSSFAGRSSEDVGRSYGDSKANATKNPESLTLSGFLAKHCCYLQGVWWRRRESNPRPEALYDQFYILSSVI